MFSASLEDHRLNKRKMIFIRYFLTTIGIGGYLFIRTPFDLFIVQVILGVSSAMLNPAYDATYSKKLDKGEESFEWSLWGGGTSIIFGLSALAGGLIVTYYSFQALFAAMLGVQMIAFFVSYFILKDGKRLII
ncbi:MAG: MFS transporter [Candidatus Aenigmarchaeota archaeon]|nr:MFS transporter [Candidatus Aenigmarchaeota archaeon]